MSPHRPNAGKTLKLWNRVTLWGSVLTVGSMFPVLAVVALTVSHPGNRMFFGLFGSLAAMAVVGFVTVRWADAIRRRPDFIADETEDLMRRLREDRGTRRVIRSR